MQEWMLSFVSNFGYFGIFFLIFIENVFPPIPSEAVLLFGGAMTVSTTMNVPGTIVCATLGSLAGAIVLYLFGYIFQAERLKKLFAGKFGKVTHLRPEHVEKAEKWFLRYQGKAVLICRCIPIVRSLISVPAGFAKMPMIRFLLLTALGSAVWNTVLVCIGAALGVAWDRAMPYLDNYTHVALAVLAVLVLAAVGYWLYRRRKGAKAAQQEDCEGAAGTK